MKKLTILILALAVILFVLWRFSPKRKSIDWTLVAKGLGLTLGMSVVLGAAAWVLTMLVDLPVSSLPDTQHGPVARVYPLKDNNSERWSDPEG